MKKRIMSSVLAGLLVAGLVGTAVFAEENTPGITLPEDQLEPARAAGVVFTDESGIFANPYTGYVSGIPAGAVAGDVLAALENKNGIEIRRGDAAIADSDKVNGGDALVLTGDDGAVKAQFNVIFVGDVDGTGVVNLSDASTMLKVIASWENVEMDEVAADVDGNGNVNLSDVSTILKKLAGWDVEFAAPILPGKPDTESKGKVACHGKNPPAGFAPLTLSDGVHYDLAVKFNVKAKEYATSLSVLCHSLADNEGKLTFSVYKWAGDYDTTVAAMPIISETFVDYKDNSNLVIDLTDTAGKGLVEGEYMWRIHEGYDDPNKAATGVGVYFYNQYGPEEETGMETFLNCKAFNIGIEADISYSMDK